MTPAQKLKLAILMKAASWGEIALPEEVNADNVDALYDEHDIDYGLQDAREEIRNTGTLTNIEDQTPWARGLSDFESESLARQASDGSWVGWTRWYGGGKYAEPSSIPWIEHAYELTCEEKQVTVTQRTFTKI
ncbi:hypothetical protein GCM10027082_24150 [Comamonas humi]